MGTKRALKESFFNEARQRVSWAESHLPELEKNPANTEVIHLILNIVHPLAGLAQFLDMTEIRKITLCIEQYLKRVLEKKRTVSLHDIDILRKMLNCFSGSITARANVTTNN